MIAVLSLIGAVIFVWSILIYFEFVDRSWRTGRRLPLDGFIPTRSRRLPNGRSGGSLMLRSTRCWMRCNASSGVLAREPIAYPTSIHPRGKVVMQRDPYSRTGWTETVVGWIFLLLMIAFVAQLAVHLLRSLMPWLGLAGLVLIALSYLRRRREHW